VRLSPADKDVSMETGIPTAGRRYIATPSEDVEAIVFAVVICKVCRLVGTL
jgi:hypothetical protein